MAMIVRTFGSRTSDREYTTQFDPETGEGHCDCPGWTFFRTKNPGEVVPPRLRVCRHLKELRLAASLPLSGPAATETPFDAESDAPASNVGRIKPMLATDMPDESTIDDFEGSPDWFAQWKYDGFRQLFRKAGPVVTNWGRPRKGESKPRVLPKRIYAAFRTMPDGIYDGEVYVPGGTSSDVQTWLGAKKVDRLDNPLRVVIYDVLELRMPNVDGHNTAALTQEERTEAVNMAVLHYTMALDQEATDLTGKAPGALITAANVLPVSRKLFLAVREAGGEGLILKRKSGRYRPGWRSTDWIKVKPEQPVTVTITGYEAGSFGPYSKMKAIEADGRTTSVKTRDTKLRNRIAADPDSFIGRAAILHFTERTPKGGLRHPRFEYFVGEGDV